MYDAMFYDIKRRPVRESNPIQIQLVQRLLIDFNWLIITSSVPVSKQTAIAVILTPCT